jgi:hypothetical protein
MEKRPSNSELKLIRLEEEEAQREPSEGILELFDQDADEALARDADAE